MKYKFLAAVLCSLLVLACPDHGPKSDPLETQAEIPAEPEAEKIGTFEGRYESSFEKSSFMTCAAPGERWWVSGDLQPLEDFIRGQGRDPIRQTTGIFVRWSGRATGLGRYGHLGGYQREFTVQKVHEIRDFRSTDCPQPDP